MEVWLGKLTMLDMTSLGWLGHKTSTQTHLGSNYAWMERFPVCWAIWPDVSIFDFSFYNIFHANLILFIFLDRLVLFGLEVPVSLDTNVTQMHSRQYFKLCLLIVYRCHRKMDTSCSPQNYVVRIWNYQALQILT